MQAVTPDFLPLPDGRRLAFHRTEGRGQGVVFLGGFRSDMTGTKAVHLEFRARAQGRPFLRFDYTGHGASSGEFLADGSIGQWAQDARNVLESLTDSPQILVGSSMGGWIALLLARAIPHRIAALVTIAAAPDFTEDSMWNGFDETQKNDLLSKGSVELPSDYSEEPYVITRKLIEDGRRNLVLRSPLSLPFPVRMLHGTADTDVELAVALRLLEHADCDDMRLTLVKGADHRFSTPECLALIDQAIAEVTPA
jgi:pimeloyl-ACP methyl ester carboxylesterase